MLRQLSYAIKNLLLESLGSLSCVHKGGLVASMQGSFICATVSNIMIPPIVTYFCGCAAHPSCSTFIIDDASFSQPIRAQNLDGSGPMSDESAPLRI